MKPTRSEIRGTWLLALLCALCVALTAALPRCGRGAPMPDAVAVPAPADTAVPARGAVPADSAAPRSGSAGASGTAASETAVKGGEKVKKGASGSKAGKRPAKVIPDNSSPLDRPVPLTGQNG